MPLPHRWSPYVLSILRVIVALDFMQHGVQKVFGMLGGVDGQGHHVPLLSLMGLAGGLEVVGGVLLVLGLLTRPTAFILSGEMAVAYFMKHFPKGAWPVHNMGELPILFCFTFLFLAAAGGGAWALDNLVFKTRRVTQVALSPPLTRSEQAPVADVRERVRR